MLVFDTLEPQFLEVKIDGKDFLLVELDTPDMTKYKSARASGVKVDGQGGFTPTNAGELDPLLVSLSLKEVLSEGKRGRVSRAFVDKLNPSTVTALAKAALDLNPALQETASVEELDRQIAKLTELRERLGEDTSKNSRNGTTRSSV